MLRDIKEDERNITKIVNCDYIDCCHIDSLHMFVGLFTYVCHVDSLHMVMVRDCKEDEKKISKIVSKLISFGTKNQTPGAREIHK